MLRGRQERPAVVGVHARSLTVERGNARFKRRSRVHDRLLWSLFSGIAWAMPATDSDIPAGSVWRQVKLGSESLYEVIACNDDDTVNVIVHLAPGLRPGARVRLSRASLATMQRVARATAAQAPERDPASRSERNR
jgi:hypothetical protein